MTNEQAIKEIKFITNTLSYRNTISMEAVDMAIKALEQQPCDDCIRELIREFDNKHPALFADYMREFNNHPISEIIEYMWDMHDLIEDIRYRLPNAESEYKE